MIEGTGSIPALIPLVVQLESRPEWLLAAPYEGGSLWAAVLTDGSVSGFVVQDGQIEEFSFSPERL
ncbi:MAG: hypothetical protein R3335_12035, partial [Anaerolineales bacterium]|nr:hypothetical protein [Anaerolineales bacterium]